MDALKPPDTWAPRPLRPGQLAPSWRLVFIAGWVGVLAGFGAIWQAARIAGIAPWWLGPESEMRSVFVVGLPFLAPLLTIVAAVVGLRSSCYIGIVAGVISGSVAFGDLHFPGLAVVEAIIGLCGILISVACLGGRMRAGAAADTPSGPAAGPTSGTTSGPTSGTSFAPPGAAAAPGAGSDLPSSEVEALG